MEFDSLFSGVSSSELEIEKMPDGPNCKKCEVVESCNTTTQILSVVGSILGGWLLSSGVALLGHYLDKYLSERIEREGKSFI